MQSEKEARLDRFDLKILNALQADATISLQELGERVGLSHTPCWRRVKRLEERGIIRKRVTLLSAEKLGLGVNVFVSLSLQAHGERVLDELEQAVERIPEVVEAYSVSGDRDYLLRIVVADVAAYERLMKHTLVNLPHVHNMSSTFALRQTKYSTELPLGDVSS